MHSSNSELGFEAWLEFGDGTRANEHCIRTYEEYEKTGPKSIAYAEVVEEMEFSIVISKKEGHVEPGDIEIRAWLDGRSLQALAWQNTLGDKDPNPRAEARTRVDHLYEKRGKRYYKVKLAFSRVQGRTLTGSDGLGDIRIELTRAKFRGITCMPIISNKPVTLAARETDEPLVRKLSQYEMISANGRPAPFYSFKWHYRTRDQLIAAGICDAPIRPSRQALDSSQLPSSRRIPSTSDSLHSIGPPSSQADPDQSSQMEGPQDSQVHPLQPTQSLFLPVSSQISMDQSSQDQSSQIDWSTTGNPTTGVKHPRVSMKTVPGKSLKRPATVPNNVYGRKRFVTQSSPASSKDAETYFSAEEDFESRRDDGADDDEGM